MIWYRQKVGGLSPVCNAKGCRIIHQSQRPESATVDRDHRLIEPLDRIALRVSLQISSHHHLDQVAPLTSHYGDAASTCRGHKTCHRFIYAASFDGKGGAHHWSKTWARATIHQGLLAMWHRRRRWQFTDGGCGSAEA